MAVKMTASKGTQKCVSLVTGATSGLGRAVVRRLVARGDEVRVILRSPPSERTSWKGLPPGAIPYVCDLTFKNKDDKKNLVSASQGVDKVFHLAGGIYNYKYNYDQLIEINVIATENLLECLADACERSGESIQLIYASSVTVYGYKRGERIDESSSDNPGSHYSESKHMAEHLIESFAETHPHLSYTIMRFGTLYGPGYEEPSFFKAFKLVKEGRMRYIGKGENHLTLVHSADAADAMLLAAEKPKVAANQIYNITDGQPHTPKELFGAVANFMGVKPPSKSINPTVARLMVKAININYDEYEFLASDRIIDISKAKKELGYEPVRRLDVDGLGMVERFMKRYKDGGVKR